MLLDWCKTLLSDGRYRQAKHLARILKGSESFEALILWSKAIELSEGPREALSALDRYLVKNAELKDEMKCRALVLKSELLVKLNQLRPALHNLQEAITLASHHKNLTEKFNLQYKLGSLYARMRNFERAQTIFDKNLGLNYDKNIKVSSRILQLKKNENIIFNGSEKNDVNSWDFIIKQNAVKKARAVYFVVGNLSTCRKFAIFLSKQLKFLADDNIHLHVHGVIADDDDSGNSEKAWSLLSEELLEQKLSVTLTRDNLCLEDFSQQDYQSAISGEKFRRISDLLTYYNLPVIAADPDILPIHDPSKLLEEDYDVGLMNNTDDVLDIISSTPSSLAVFKTSREAFDFAKELESGLGLAEIKPKQTEAILVATQHLSVNCKIKLFPETINETNIKNRNIYDVYRTDAKFVGKNSYETTTEFLNFLHEHYSNLNPLILARAIGTNGNYKVAHFLIETYLKNNTDLSKPEQFEVLQLRALIYAHANELEKSQSVLKQAQKIIPKGKGFERARAISLYQLGSVSAALGDTSEAQTIFDKNITIDCDNGWETHTGIINLHSGAEQIPPTQLTYLHDTPISDKIKCIYTVCADLKYCQEFAPALIQKFQELRSTGVHLNIHGIVLNQSEDVLSKDWDRLAATLRDTNLSCSLSVGHMNLGELTVQQHKSIYASERFRLLPKLLKKYELPIVVADIDQFPLKDVTAMLKSGYDAEFLYLPKSVLNFLSVISATLSVFYHSKNGIALAERLKAYFDDAYVSKDKLGWHLDQAALAAMYYAPGPAKIGCIDSDVVQRNPFENTPVEALENGASFWSVTSSMDSNLNAFWRLESQKNNNHLKQQEFT